VTRIEIIDDVEGGVDGRTTAVADSAPVETCHNYLDVKIVFGIGRAADGGEA
jgi:hypothetical protein